MVCEFVPYLYYVHTKKKSLAMAFDCGANKSKQTRGNCNQYSSKEAINGTNKMRLAEVLDYYYVLYFINPLESAEIKCRRKGKNVLMNDACILAA